MLVVVLCGYQIYEFQMGLRFILSLNSACKGIKLYLHEVLDSDIVVFAILCGLQCRTYIDILKSKVLQGDSGEEVACGG